MTISPPLGSEQHFAFDQLAEPVRRWIWQQGWPRLRDVQVKAIPAVLAGGDVLISARTAAGKTEAALLPLITRALRRERSVGGFDVLYVSPLKALINNQFQRLESLCDACDLPLHRWHGDVDSTSKQKARNRPSGILLITPESLEATLMRRGSEVSGMFGALQAIVIDELHAFIGRERGMHLQSILTRIEAACGRERFDRIGLSATLGDMALAAEFMSPGRGPAVSLVEGNDAGNGVQLQIRGYAAERASRGNEEVADDRPPPSHAHREVVDDALRLLGGSNHLLFAGSRPNVEKYTDALRVACEAKTGRNEFFAHHGNLSKAEREDVEARLRAGHPPTTAVATTTLELGIDLGDVETVAQIGPGFSVSSLRQRLGRSGRRAGRAAVMRMFIIEDGVDGSADALRRLRLSLVQAVAMVECMKEGWVEPPDPAGLHLSTLLHQTLALIVQTGPIRPIDAYRQLCQRGPFRQVDQATYAQLLRAMAASAPPLLEMSLQGELMLGEGGEWLTMSQDFFAVFETPLDYRVLHGARELGVLPLTSVVSEGQTLIFSGRRWLVNSLDDDARVILVSPSTSALPPSFSGEGGAVHDYVVERMRKLLLGTDMPAYLNPTARQMLSDAREAFFSLELDQSAILQSGRGAHLFPWVGTRKLDTLAVWLRAKNFKASVCHHRIDLDECDAEGLANALKNASTGPSVAPEHLARMVNRPPTAKFDHFLSDELRTQVTLAERLDVKSLPVVIARCLRGDWTITAD